MSEDAAPVIVPFDTLSAAALRGVIESVVLREGTDYGTHEFSLTDKVAHVRRQLECGEAQVVFDPRTDSIDIVRVVRPSPARRGDADRG